MTPDAMAQAVALYRTIRNERDPDALQAWTSWDALPAQVTTTLPVVVCCMLTQYARCRRWQAYWQAQGRDRDIRTEGRRIAPIEKYFVILEDMLRKAQEGDT